jgi:hypothetical protein
LRAASPAAASSSWRAWRPSAAFRSEASPLGALEAGEGSVEGVLQATFVALEAEEGVSLGGGGSEGWGEGVIEELLVQAGEASDLPVADGDLLDEQLFSVGRRLVGLAEVFEVLVEVGLALDDAARCFVAVGDDSVLREKAVLDGVFRGSGFAFGGFGSCGTLGVATVGSELFGGDGHGLFLWRTVTVWRHDAACKMR